MGFVDLVGTASNYVQQDLELTDSQANILPSLVFFWFLMFSVPTGMLMNRIGRKQTVLVSLAITLVSLIIPIFADSYIAMLTAFSLLGIGNALMQTSLNPLVTNIISSDKLASTLTFGQFVKAIASFLAPVIASWGAISAYLTFGFGWKILFPIYSAICLLSFSMLWTTDIKEEPQEKASSFVDCLKLLGKPFILFCFIGIVCHVGIDVGINTIAPKILIEKLNIPLDNAAIAIGIYFLFRTMGSFSGSILLRKFEAKTLFTSSVSILLLAMIGLFIANDLELLYCCIALIGLGNSNIFSIIYSQALINSPRSKNAVSGLLIMGLFGGTIFPLAMGYASDAINSQNGAIVVMMFGVLYLLFYASKIKKA
jgi:fucose permease